jgi:hypothetical protein
VSRPLREIAADIVADWDGKMYFGAIPYVEAMAYLDSIDDMYGADRARDIVNYFLANARTWRGETARSVKAELKVMLATK